VATAANLHLAACTPNFKIQEHFNDFADAWVKGAVHHYPEVVDGYFELPDKPGLGVTLVEEFVAEHPRERTFFNLFEEGWHKRQAKV
jgi:galactonate dehydratase